MERAALQMAGIGSVIRVVRARLSKSRSATHSPGNPRSCPPMPQLKTALRRSNRRSLRFGGISSFSAPHPTGSKRSSGHSRTSRHSRKCSRTAERSARASPCPCRQWQPAPVRPEELDLLARLQYGPFLADAAEASADPVVGTPRARPPIRPGPSCPTAVRLAASNAAVVVVTMASRRFMACTPRNPPDARHLPR